MRSRCMFRRCIRNENSFGYGKKRQYRTPGKNYRRGENRKVNEGRARHGGIKIQQVRVRMRGRRGIVVMVDMDNELRVAMPDA